MSEPAESMGRCPAPTVQQILDREKNPVPAALRECSWEDLGDADIPRERYFSRAFHDLEMERMWSRVWQMACREEDIPQVGDHVLYEIGDTSLIVVRAAEGRIKALHNVCLHRGRLLRTCGGNVRQLRCPFHAFTWNLDGTLKDIPCRWDFPHVKDEEFSLPEAEVDTWGGFVFINLDPQAAPLREYLDPIPRHFEHWPLEERYKTAHVGKIVRANWKICAEAFMESFHVIATHPQIMPSTADANTQYDLYPHNPHVNRMITAMGVPSPHLGENYPEEKIVEQMMREYAGAGGSSVAVKLPPGKSAREFLGQMLRNMVGMSSGANLSKATDSEMLDAIQYFAFPNFFPWGGLFQNIVYRFRPNGHDPESCLMEVLLLAPLPKNGSRPKPARYHLLEEDAPWTDARELGLLGAVFDQDMSNIPYVQRGLRATKKNGVTLGHYQESRIRHLHKTLDRYLERAPDAGEGKGRL